jgi:hypothetical protein
MAQSKKRSQATTLVELALETAGLELFHTHDGDPFVVIPQGTHSETWPLRGGPFRRWLARLCFEQEGTAPGSQALQDALGVLEGTALFRGDELDVHLRLAEHEGAIYLDLVDEYWQAIRITRAGWEVVSDPPVRFWRARGMRSLPYPVNGSQLEALREFVNVADEDWPLYLGWLVAALRPAGPFTVMLVHGEQGSAKSTAVRVARAIVDPNEAPVRREPRDGRDLVVAARNGWVVAYDNVSYLPQWLSDDIARLATGIGFGTRQLYTDTDEVIVNVSRPVVLNGITEVATRGDLLDRGLVLSLPTIKTYTPEDEFWTAFDAAHPRILGALLDAAVCALRRIDEIEVGHLRMADFAKWVVAAEPALGLAPGQFIASYEDNRAGRGATDARVVPDRLAPGGDRRAGLRRHGLGPT